MSERAAIDLNADVGEGFGRWALGDDDALLGIVSSANVACGFHAGDPSIMRRTCAAAVAHGVRIGAHVGYRDRAGFGRRRLDVAPAELRDETVYQLGALIACAAAEGGAVTHVKPHGALYHRCSEDPDAAAALVEAVRSVGPRLAVVGAPGSELLALAGDDGVAEGFADRGLHADGTLVPRGEPGAVLRAEEAAAQAVRIATGGTAEGVRTLCVHGDTPDAVALARAVRDGLERAGVAVAPFA